MNHSHLTSEVEFCYLINWFKEFSEYEKTDFMTILIQWLLKPNDLHVNGENEHLKPSIFYCRMKLFREWSSKWPDQLRSKLIDRINELDSDFGLKLNQALEAHIEQLDQKDVQQNEDLNSIQVCNSLAELHVTED